MGLSGLGDLMLTCNSPASRNYSLGFGLGRGTSLAAIMAEREGVTEGVATTPALLMRAGDLDLPICRAVAGLLSGEWTVGRAIESLMTRPSRDE